MTALSVRMGELFQIDFQALVETGEGKGQKVWPLFEHLRSREMLCVLSLVHLEQSEPSKPEKQLVSLPQSKAARRKALKRLFHQIANEELAAKDSDLDYGESSTFADYFVSFGEVYLLANVVEFPIES